jgi:hypothetical protein
MDCHPERMCNARIARDLDGRKRAITSNIGIYGVEIPPHASRFVGMTYTFLARTLFTDH